MDRSINFNTAGCGHAKRVKCTTTHLCAKGLPTYVCENTQYTNYQTIVLKAIIRHLWWEAYTICLYTTIVESPFDSRDGSGLKTVTKSISEALKFLKGKKGRMPQTSPDSSALCIGLCPYCG